MDVAELSELKQGHRAMWDSGDYASVAERYVLGAFGSAHGAHVARPPRLRSSRAGRRRGGASR